MPLVGYYEGEGSPRVTVRVLFMPEYENKAKPALDATIVSLEYFSRSLFNRFVKEITRPGHPPQLLGEIEIRVSNDVHGAWTLEEASRNVKNPARAWP